MTHEATAEAPNYQTPVGRLADRAALLDLATHLNRRYNVDLAHLQQYGTGQFLLVRRGTAVSDVAVAVSIDHTGDQPLYRVEAYTWVAWCCEADAFVSLLRESIHRTAQAVERFIPLDPSH
jgi:hypothetical protein